MVHVGRHEDADNSPILSLAGTDQIALPRLKVFNTIRQFARRPGRNRAVKATEAKAVIHGSEADRRHPCAGAPVLRRNRVEIVANPHSMAFETVWCR